MAVDGGPEHGVARRLVHRDGLAGEHRLVDRRGARADTAVDRDLLARPDPDHLAGGQVGCGDQPLGPVGQDEVGLLGLEFDQGTHRGRRPAPAPGLQPPAEEEEGDDEGGHVEVEVLAEGAGAAPGVGGVIVGLDARAEKQLSGGENERRECSKRDERVHADAAGPGPAGGTFEKWPSAPELDGDGQNRSQPTGRARVGPEGGDREHRQGQGPGDDQPPPPRRLFGSLLVGGGGSRAGGSRGGRGGGGGGASRASVFVAVSW